MVKTFWDFMKLFDGFHFSKYLNYTNIKLTGTIQDAYMQVKYTFFYITDSQQDKKKKKSKVLFHIM